MISNPSTEKKVSKYFGQPTFFMAILRSDLSVENANRLNLVLGCTLEAPRRTFVKPKFVNITSS
jgi:hypothetical protein